MLFRFSIFCLFLPSRQFLAGGRIAGQGSNPTTRKKFNSASNFLRCDDVSSGAAAVFVQRILQFVEKAVLLFYELLSPDGRGHVVNRERTALVRSFQGNAESDARHGCTLPFRDSRHDPVHLCSMIGLGPIRRLGFTS